MPADRSVGSLGDLISNKHADPDQSGYVAMHPSAGSRGRSGLIAFCFKRIPALCAPPVRPASAMKLALQSTHLLSRYLRFRRFETAIATGMLRLHSGPRGAVPVV